MTKKEKQRMAMVFFLFLALALYQDCTSGNLKENGVIERDSSNGEEKEISLILDAGEILKDYEYELVLEPAKVTKEEAEGLLQKAREEIEVDFESWNKELPIKKKYCDGMVKANWELLDREYINSQGKVLQENIPKEGVICTAEVTLTCGNYEQKYHFPFQIKKAEPSKQEQLLQALEQWMEQQMEQEGEMELQLPTELNGVPMDWKEKRESFTLQTLLLEMVALVLILWGRKKQKEQEEKVRIRMVEMGYPDVVNQLAMLLEAGMTIRQAWKKIADQYVIKRNRQMVEMDPVLEAVVCMSRRLSEGESERVAYGKFAEEVNVRCYRRLMQTLLHHLEKGTTGLCTYLEEECRQAYDLRILTAKKMGEEASTKMLFPLMLMMLLVMVIVMLPAIIEIAA